MNRLLIILFAVLFVDFIIAMALELSILATGFAGPGKIMKLLAIYLLLVVFLFNLRRLSLHKGVLVYFLFSLMIIVPYYLHYLYGHLYGTSAIQMLRPQKELVRLASMVLIMGISFHVKLRSEDLTYFIRLFCILAVFTAAVSILHSMTGVSVFEARRFGSFVRAGSDLVDANYLGAVLNLFTFIAIAGYFIAPKGSRRNRFFYVALFCIAARFMTLSNGALLSFLVSLVAAIVISRRYNETVFKIFVSRAAMCVVAFFVILMVTNIDEFIFARLKPDSVHIQKSSVGSRVKQIVGFKDLVVEEPSVLLWGVGPSGLRKRIVVSSRELHNSYLRTLGGGGIFAFTGFMGLVYLCFRNFSVAVRTSRKGSVQSILSIFLYSSFIGWFVQAGTAPADSSVLYWFFFILAYILRRSVEYDMRSNDEVVSHEPPSVRLQAAEGSFVK